MKQIDDKEVSLMYGDSCESTILIDQGPWQIWNKKRKSWHLTCDWLMMASIERIEGKMVFDFWSISSESFWLKMASIERIEEGDGVITVYFNSPYEVGTQCFSRHTKQLLLLYSVTPSMSEIDDKTLRMLIVDQGWAGRRILFRAPKVKACLHISWALCCCKVGIVVLYLYIILYHIYLCIYYISYI